MKKIFSSILAMVILVLSIAASITATAVDKQINYKSTMPPYKVKPVSISSEVSEYLNDFVRKHDKYMNLYIVIDNYDLYKELRFDGKSKSFFKDNLLIINFLHCGIGSAKTRQNIGVGIKDGVINVSYTCTIKYPIPAVTYYTSDFIELKKSDVKGVDLTKQTVNIKTTHMNCGEDPHDSNQTIEMKYINLEKLIKKPEQVKKVKTQSPKKKQLKVTWKKIKGSKYQLEYSLKKSMNNVYLKKNIKKNSVTLKKLKSNKKYYIRVRAYKTVNGKKYFGKWSKKAVKAVK